jgi:hypothetical protein
MSEPEPLFREEALEYQARQRGPGELLRLSAAWLDWAYWGLLALVAIGLVAGLLLRVGGDPLLFVLVPPLRTLFERLRG